ncbi:MAG: type II toxin-antitoxin system RelE/ParE family toxin [Myxococcales bacterium]|nr:type II toxin-antitoxin system RelE/ParE family toxin [Myxococcales bacterium]
MKILWTGPAIADVESVRTYIEPDDPRAAARVVLRITSAVEPLVTTPFIGRPGRVSGTRELVLVDVPYIVAYRVVAGVVEVLRVLHTSRRWPRRLVPK